MPVGLQSHEWLVFPYVGIIQIRFQVKTNKVSSQPIFLSSLFSFLFYTIY